MKADNMVEGIRLWGYSAFEKLAPVALVEHMTLQQRPLGKLTYSELLEDRCLISAKAQGAAGAGEGTYVTLQYLNEYEHGARKEQVFLFEPKEGGEGFKIIGLRGLPIGTGRQGLFDLAASLGQLAVLKLHGAPQPRWAPYQREAGILAGLLKLTLPPIPDVIGSGDEEDGKKLAQLLLQDAVALVENAKVDGGKSEAKAILNAFAVLMLYLPGDESSTRLAVLAGSEAEKAGMPDAFWKPLIKAVSGKQPLPGVNEAVQGMVRGTSLWLYEQQSRAEIAGAPKEVIEKALTAMASLHAYHVRGEFHAADGRKSVMDADLAPGAMDLTLQGFDGARERRLVVNSRFRISRDEGKTWAEDKDGETAIGLCRTLQTPLDLTRKVTSKHTFGFGGEEVIEKEPLYRFDTEGENDPPMSYWILMTRRGPVVRRAAMTMTFGKVETEALFIYTELGKVMDIPDPLSPKEQEAAEGE